MATREAPYSVAPVRVPFASGVLEAAGHAACQQIFALLTCAPGVAIDQALPEGIIGRVVKSGQTALQRLT